MVQMSDNPLAITSMISSEPAEHAGASCLVGQRAPNAAGMASDYVDPKGHHMTGHWVVPPGKQVNSSDATWFMNLPYDSKLHYAAVHLHPFAQSLTLRDATAGADLFKAQTVNPKNRVGLDRVDAFVSMEGVPMYKDHKYELISVYNNPTKQNADSMASMFLALDDPEFAAPTSAELISRGTIITDGTAVVLRTSEGDFGAMLMNQQVPATVLAFARLVNSGAFAGAEAKVSETAITFTTPLTPEFKRLLYDSAVETKQLHIPGSLSLCPTADTVSFVVVTRSSPDLDGRCTVFAQVGPGGEVIRAINAAGSVHLVRGEILSGPELNDLQLAPAKKIASR
jgi:cyclophilin family peptidyl-prolyl cis-trans isomerase